MQLRHIKNTKRIKIFTSTSDIFKLPSNELSSKSFSSGFSEFELHIKSNSKPASCI